jgi:hypothetical protein
MIDLRATGLVYRNPKPHLRALHAWHPSLVRLDSGELLASFDLAQAVEGLDYRTYLARSPDEGQTWGPPVPLFADTVSRRATHTVRLSRTTDGTLLGFGGRFYRDDPEEGLTNRANLGFVPMDLILLQSRDGGHTWHGPTTLQPPLVGPAFEICHAIVELPDSRWLAPTSTWRGWDGQAPNGMKAVALVSADQGRTWPEYLDVMDDYGRGTLYWEQSLVPLPDGRLLAVAWAFDEKKGTSLPTPYTLAQDGRTFAPPRLTGLRGQTAKVLRLDDGRILCLYRRDDKLGLWAGLARIEGDAWVNLDEAVLWQGAGSGMTGTTNASEELGRLKFGYPSLVQLPGGDVLAAFWCWEDGLSCIRWVRLGVKGTET